MLKRYSLLLMGGAFVGILAAQQNTPHRFFEAEQPLDMGALRQVFIALNDLDPAVNVFHSDDLRILQIEANPQVSDTELRTAIAGTGVLLKAGLYQPPAQPLVQTAADGSPIMVLTGDLEADRARYQQAVQDWNTSNPEAPIQPLDTQAADQ